MSFLGLTGYYRRWILHQLQHYQSCISTQSISHPSVDASQVSAQPVSWLSLSTSHLPVHMQQISRLFLADISAVRGSLHTSQISHLVLYPSLWLLVPGLSSHFCHYFLYNLLLRSTPVSNIFGKRL